MIDFLIALAVSAVGVACLMEVLKATVNGMRSDTQEGRLRGREGFSLCRPTCGGFSAASCPSWQPSLHGNRCLHPRNPRQPCSPFSSGWFLGIWIPIVWWVQMQLDMQVIKKYAVPIIKKVLAKKLEVDDD